MRLVVLDTNVVVSAGIRADGAPAQLIRDWVMRRQVQMVCSPFVAAEYREVTRREKFRPYDFAPFLALAHASGAWLVTGNLKHFPEAARAGVRVISPGNYLEYLGGSVERP
jgi:predicted nucleic acid-binding protein